MLSFSSRQRYFLYRGATDMRKGFKGLSGLVRQHISHELTSGDAFVFLNRRRDRITAGGSSEAKLLVWDRNGFVVWYKVLEQGTFELPAAEMDTLELSWTDLHLLLEGIEIKSVKRRPRSSSAAKKMPKSGLIKGDFSYFYDRWKSPFPERNTRL